MKVCKDGVKVGTTFFIPAKSLECGTVHSSVRSLEQAAESNRGSYFGYGRNGDYNKEATVYEVKITKLRKLKYSKATVI